jgi:hypothetical protein
MTDALKGVFDESDGAGNIGELNFSTNLSFSAFFQENIVRAKKNSIESTSTVYVIC